MKTVEPRSLITEMKRNIVIPAEVEKTFNNWLKRIKKVKYKNEQVEPLEIFYAGYILANPNVREKYKEAEKIRIIKILP